MHTCHVTYDVSLDVLLYREWVPPLYTFINEEATQEAHSMAITHIKKGGSNHWLRKNPHACKRTRPQSRNMHTYMYGHWIAEVLPSNGTISHTLSLSLSPALHPQKPHKCTLLADMTIYGKRLLARRYNSHIPVVSAYRWGGNNATRSSQWTSHSAKQVAHNSYNQPAYLSYREQYTLGNNRLYISFLYLAS